MATRDAAADGAASPAFAERIGIPPALTWGFAGLLLFMIGDGVESGYLSPFLTSNGVKESNVALLLTVYGVTVAISSWLSGALSDLFGPKRVMWLGLGIWAVFEVLFLLFGIAHVNYPIMLLTYGLRGFGYPLFAFGFLVWIAAVTPRERLGTAAGWFWFAFTGGLPTLGSAFASVTIPAIGEYATFWLSLGLVTTGGLIALLCVHEPTGAKRLTPPGEKPITILFSSVTIAWAEPKLAIGGVVRLINTTAEYGFLVFLPLFFTHEIGFSLAQWLRLLSVIFASNIIANLIFGVVGDRLGWRNTIIWFGGVGCAVTTLLLYYVPIAFKGNYPLALGVGVLYGFTLAGYVPLSALMPTLTPQHKGAAMSILNLGAGASTGLGPAIAGIFLGALGVKGVMWIFAGLYLASAVMAFFLTLPEETSQSEAGQSGAAAAD